MRCINHSFAFIVRLLVLFLVLPLMGTTIPGGRYQRADGTWVDANGSRVKSPAKAETEAAEDRAEAERIAEAELQAKAANSAGYLLEAHPAANDGPASRRNRRE